MLTTSNSNVNIERLCASLYQRLDKYSHVSEKTESNNQAIRVIAQGIKALKTYSSEILARREEERFKDKGPEILYKSMELLDLLEISRKRIVSFNKEESKTLLKELKLTIVQRLGEIKKLYNHILNPSPSSIELSKELENTRSIHEQSLYELTFVSVAIGDGAVAAEQKMNECENEKTILRSLEGRITDALSVLEQTKTQEAQVQNLLACLNPIPRSYEKRTEDPLEIAPAFKYNHATTMRGLLECALRDSIGELLLETERLHCISSMENFDSKDHLRSIYGHAILKLLQQARLTKTGGCDDLSVIELNQSAFSRIYYSQPVNARLKGDKIRVTFMQPCSWALEPIGSDNRGIDPVGVKWILQRLTQDEIGILETLLLSPFMLREEPSLVAAQEFILQNDHEQAKIVKIGFELISTMAIYIDERYTVELKKALIEVAEDNNNCIFDRNVPLFKQGLQ